jgi:hypothetical protein
MTGTSLKPWYREPWPWLLMIAPAAAVTAGAVTVVLALQSYDGLVAEDYYKQGLAVNQRLARAEKARALGISGSLNIAAATGGEVHVQLRGQPADARGALVLALTHPTRAGYDQTVPLAARQEGYAGRIGALAPGRWHVIVESADAAWRIRGELQIPQQTAATLAPGA